ncbi:MAG TPA: hypothetical protein VFZ66_26705 [Herpetosiphonaceae bacterium]
MADPVAGKLANTEIYVAFCGKPGDISDDGVADTDPGIPQAQIQPRERPLLK